MWLSLTRSIRPDPDTRRTSRIHLLEVSVRTCHDPPLLLPPGLHQVSIFYCPLICESSLFHLFLRPFAQVTSKCTHHPRLDDHRPLFLRKLLVDLSTTPGGLKPRTFQRRNGRNDRNGGRWRNSRNNEGTKPTDEYSRSLSPD